MTNFTYELESVQTDALTLDYFLVPWDTEIVAQPVAEIARIEITEPEKASGDYRAFRRWCETHDIALCSCRISHDRSVESMFLQAQGFRFVELNYQPRLNKVQDQKLSDDAILVEPAGGQDREVLAEMAGSVFRHGRFHQDPRLGAELGNRRYRKWLLNCFEQTHHRVLKFMLDGELIAFFVVKYPQQGQCFWSLGSLAPGRQGQGLGKRVWRTMLRNNQQEGIERISTSISSLNIAVLNLYVSLGFQFPAPNATFHWCPSDARPMS